MAGHPPQEKTKFWQAPDLGRLDLLHATYITHTFSRHIHHGYAIGVIERGAETFFYRGKIHIAPAGSVVIINPGEVHTGQAVTGAGWTYRMLYPEADLVLQAARQIEHSPDALPDFPEPVIFDPRAIDLIRRLHWVLESSTSPLERQSHFTATMAQLVANYAHGRHRLLPPADAPRTVVAVALDYLHSHFDQPITLDDIAALTHFSPYHFLRVFKNAMGLTPHAYLTQLRVDAARRRLSAGQPLAQVATETGFVDQSHFTRSFKRITGVTPGQYAQYSNNIQYISSSSR